MRITSYRDLDVWQKAIKWVEKIYRDSAKFPPDERYGLTSQLRRAAVSVPANIAEGSARSGTKDLLRFIGIAQGSLAESETLLTLAHNLGILPSEQTKLLLADAKDISRMLAGLKKSLSSKL